LALQALFLLPFSSTIEEKFTSTPFFFSEKQEGRAPSPDSEVIWIFFFGVPSLPPSSSRGRVRVVPSPYGHRLQRCRPGFFFLFPSNSKSKCGCSGVCVRRGRFFFLDCFSFSIAVKKVPLSSGVPTTKASASFYFFLFPFVRGRRTHPALSPACSAEPDAYCIFNGFLHSEETTRPTPFRRVTGAVISSLLSDRKFPRGI